MKHQRNNQNRQCVRGRWSWAIVSASEVEGVGKPRPLFLSSLGLGAFWNGWDKAPLSPSQPRLVFRIIRSTWEGQGNGRMTGQVAHKGGSIPNQGESTVRKNSAKSQSPDRSL